MVAETKPDECRICNQKYTDDGMVRCDECLEWTHFDCAGVDDTIAEVNWSCPSCLEKAEPKNHAAKTPSVEELLTTMAKSQAREDAIHKQISSMAKEITALKLELAERRKLPPPPAAAAAEPLTVPCKSVTAAANTGHGSSEFSEVIGLMKLSHARDLPAFHGTLKDWPYFLSVYNQTTVAASIDDETNVGRLDKALAGEARELVLDQLTLGRRPSEIIDTLQRRYGNKDALLRHLASHLIEFPRIQSTKDPSLRRFAVAIKTYVAQMRTMKLQEELNSSLLVAHLHDKLSNLPSMFRRWTRMKSESPEPIVEVFANFLLDHWEHLPPALTWADNAGPLDKGRHVKSLGDSSASWEPGEDFE
jgi:ribosomal protein L17